VCQAVPFQSSICARVRLRAFARALRGERCCFAVRPPRTCNAAKRQSSNASLHDGAACLRFTGLMARARSNPSASVNGACLRRGGQPRVPHGPGLQGDCARGLQKGLQLGVSARARARVCLRLRVVYVRVVSAAVLRFRRRETATRPSDGVPLTTAAFC